MVLRVYDLCLDKITTDHVINMPSDYKKYIFALEVMR